MIQIQKSLYFFSSILIVDEPLDSDLEQDEENVIVDKPRDNDLEHFPHLVQDHCQEVHQQSHFPHLPHYQEVHPQ